MPNVWFTADTHFGHANIIKYCERPFLNDEEQRRVKDEARGNWRVCAETIRNHDESLMDAINSAVHPTDTLWIIGDFCWGDYDQASRYRQWIKCKDVRLVWGNHDHRSIQPLFQKTIEQGMISVDRQKIWLNHYPMRSWDKAFHGSWHLYGHVHGRLDKEDAEQNYRLTKDAGVDACEYRPIGYDELEAYMSPRIKAFEKKKSELQL